MKIMTKHTKSWESCKDTASAETVAAKSKGGTKE